MKKELKNTQEIQKTESKASKKELLQKFFTSGPATHSATIYREDLYEDCKTPKEKRALRVKIRRATGKFISDFLKNQKNPAELKALQKRWVEYAAIVYKDVNYICDGNTKEENQEIYSKFTKAMAQEYK